MKTRFAKRTGLRSAEVEGVYSVNGLRSSRRLAFLLYLWSWGAVLLQGVHPGVAAASHLIKDSKHNLSVSGPGEIKSGVETQICVFCHTPHSANPAVPLWNHAAGASTYQTYTSRSLEASPGQPNGSSKLCLSCHDGTVAVGLTVRRGNLLDVTLASRSTSLGADLRNDHPVSFEPRAGSELYWPPNLGQVRGDAQGRLQCTSCHDPHDDYNGKFLVVAQVDAGGRGGYLCRACHNKAGWVDGSIHRDSTASYTIGGTTKTIKEWGCTACHAVHNASEGPRLYNDFNPTQTVEEGLCYDCHDGSPASKDVKAEFNRTYRHPVAAQGGVHFPTESYQSGNPDQPARHAECADCHNPHAAKKDASPPARPGLWGSLVGASGVEVSYGSSPWVPPVFTYKSSLAWADREYMLCFKCHSSYSYGANPPLSPSSGQPQTDLSVQFNPNNQSYHLVGIPGSTNKTIYGGKFVPPWTKDSVLYCTDCHASSGGTVAGPHGSNYPFLLVAPWDATTGREGYDTRHHLCFRCHDYNYYTGNYRKEDTTYQIQSDFSKGGSNPGVEDLNLHWKKKHGSIHGCQACHAKIPHGMNHPGLLAEDGVDPERYSMYSYLKINTWGNAGEWYESRCNHSAQGPGCD